MDLGEMWVSRAGSSMNEASGSDRILSPPCCRVWALRVKTGAPAENMGLEEKKGVFLYLFLVSV